MWSVAAAIGAASVGTSAAGTSQPTEPSVVTNKAQLIAIDDLKAVFAVVQSARVVPARARIGGTIAALSVEEGSQVTAGQQIAEVTDQKLALKIESLEAQIKGLQSRVTNARADLDRAQQLIARGFSTEAKVGELRTAHDVAVNQLKSAVAERQVVTEQVGEGAVLAPAGGRVLTVPVTPGSVIMPGETIATIAINRYILRLEIPERHARFIKNGDKIMVGARGLNAAGEAPVGEGRIVKVYPELRDGTGGRRRRGRRARQIFRGRAGRGVDFGRQAGGHRHSARLCVPPRGARLCDGWRKEGGASIDVVVQLGQPAVVVKAGRRHRGARGAPARRHAVKP